MPKILLSHSDGEFMCCKAYGSAHGGKKDEQNILYIQLRIDLDDVKKSFKMNRVKPKYHYSARRTKFIDLDNTG